MKLYTLITGATSGIGLATAHKLASTNNLLLVGRSEDKLVHLKKDLGSEHLYLCCDLIQVEVIADLFINFLKTNNALVNKLIHCAAVDQSLPARCLNTAVIDQVMKVNFYSIVEIINVLLKRSVNRSVLRNILFVSSISAIRGFKAKAAYSASKAALDAYMRVISKELAPKICVNSILPGAVPTSMSQNEFNNHEVVKHFEEIYPLGIGSVEKVIEIIIFHHNMDDSWVTGQQVVVDGGMTC
jgi:NAD(P)-dependent dehydrogenase (short-subunit alcohol dehydrogenase family)